MMRNLTDAAPQRGDVAFRSGQQGASETPEERAFRSQAGTSSTYHTWFLLVLGTTE